MARMKLTTCVVWRQHICAENSALYVDNVPCLNNFLAWNFWWIDILWNRCWNNKEPNCVHSHYHYDAFFREDTQETSSQLAYSLCRIKPETHSTFFHSILRADLDSCYKSLVYRRLKNTTMLPLPWLWVFTGFRLPSVLPACLILFMKLLTPC